MYNKSLSWPVFKEINPISFVFDDLFTHTRYEPHGFGDMGEHYLLDVEMPGVKKENIKIEYVDNKIVIEAERKMGKSVSKFTRSYGLPQNVERDAVTASYSDGVLSITLPKKLEAKPKLIEIK